MSFNAQADIDILNIGNFDKAEAKIIVGLGSRHFDSVKHEMLNESNPSVGFEAWDIQAVYVSENSWGKQSLYLTYAPDYEINSYLSIFCNFGIATGYTCDQSVSNKDYTLTPEYCSDSGIVALPAITMDFHPLANGFALSLSFTPSAVMLSASYPI